MTDARIRLIADLRDYALGEGAFEDKQGAYLGMAASRYPETLIQFFRDLPETERRVLADLLCDVHLGKVPELDEWFGILSSDLLSFALAGHGQYFADYISSLEAVFNEEVRVAVWLEAGDADGLPNGREYATDWHYPLSLSAALLQLGARGIDETYARLEAAAKSEHFRESLKRNRELLPVDFEAMEREGRER